MPKWLAHDNLRRRDDGDDSLLVEKSRTGFERAHSLAIATERRIAAATS